MGRFWQYQMWQLKSSAFPSSGNLYQSINEQMFKLRFKDCLDLYKCFYSPIVENMFCKSPPLGAAVKKEKRIYAEPIFLEMLNLKNLSTFLCKCLWFGWFGIVFGARARCFYFFKDKNWTERSGKCQVTQSARFGKLARTRSVSLFTWLIIQTQEHAEFGWKCCCCQWLGISPQTTKTFLISHRIIRTQICVVRCLMGVQLCTMYPLLDVMHCLWP